MNKNIKIKLRDAKDQDMELVMAWRSNPLIYKDFHIQQGPLSFEEHLDWWKSQKNWRQWIVVYGEGNYTRDVGKVDVRYLETDCPEVSYFIGELPLWGKGVGTQAVKLALEWLGDNGYKKACAKVLEDNERSKRLLTNLGFKLTNEKEVLRYEVAL